jgi:predicted 2-oxoglutarate/Fe(II)-dependent dioxygenase YbiX
VGYLNDDYEGGELFFDKLNLKIKPQAGDLYLFPSSYIYSHAAMPVTDGTKYSIVTMLDYLEAPHTPEYREIEKRYTEGYA